MSAVLDSGRRKKVKRLADKIVEVHSYDLNAQKNWPQIFGYYVTINNITPNQGGKERPSEKFRKRPQVNIVTNNAEAESEFNRLYGMKLDEKAVDARFFQSGDALFDRLQHGDNGPTRNFVAQDATTAFDTINQMQVEDGTEVAAPMTPM